MSTTFPRIGFRKFAKVGDVQRLTAECERVAISGPGISHSPRGSFIRRQRQPNAWRWLGYIIVGTRRWYDPAKSSIRVGSEIVDGSSGQKLKLVVKLSDDTVTYQPFTGHWANEPADEIWFYVPHMGRVERVNRV